MILRNRKVKGFAVDPPPVLKRTKTVFKLDVPPPPAPPPVTVQSLQDAIVDAEEAMEREDRAHEDFQVTMMHQIATLKHQLNTMQHANRLLEAVKQMQEEKEEGEIIDSDEEGQTTDTDATQEMICQVPTTPPSKPVQRDTPPEMEVKMTVRWDKDRWEKEEEEEEPAAKKRLELSD